MRKHLLDYMGAALASLVLAASLVPAVPQSAYATEPNYAELPADAVVPGEIIVTYTGDMADASDIAALVETGAAVNASSPTGIAMSGQILVDEADVIVEGDGSQAPSVLKLTLGDASQAADAIALLDALPGVEAQPNYLYRLVDEVDAQETPAVQLLRRAEESAFEASATNDPRYGSLYHLFPWSDEDGATCGANVEAMWDEVRGDMMPSVVAVLDTGVRIDHEDLAANIDMVHMASVSDTDDTVLVPGVMDDVSGHGTHVAGTIAAVTGNGVGVAGAAYNATVLPIRIFRDANTASTATILAGLEYLEELIVSGEVQNLHVVNMSITGYDDPGSVDRQLVREIQLLRSRYDVLMVCAAGNDHKMQISYPSDYEEVFSVTSLSKKGGNLGSSNYNQLKDISAPGEGILSTTWSATSSYGTKNGTSMAAPVVSSIAALLWAENPDLTVSQAIEAMQKTAHSVANKPNYYDPSIMGSAGAIDGYAALQYVKANFPDNHTMLAKAEAEAIDPQLYTGEELNPQVTLRYDGKTLVEGVDFEAVSYANNVDEGTATVVLEGMGSFKGRLSLDFEIIPNLGSSKTSVAAIGAQEYTGDDIEPVPTVKYGGKRLRYGTDFTLRYEDNVTGPVGCVVVIGTGAYAGEARAYFAIEGTPDEQAVKQTTALIDALPDPGAVTLDDADAIDRARIAVANLTDAQRALMDPEKLQRFEEVFAAYDALAVTIERIAGENYANETSAAISERMFSHSEWVVLARDDDFADALGATGLAGVLGAPILLTNRMELSQATWDEIERLEATRCYIVGGPGAMAASLETELEAAGIVQVERLWGENSYDTSLACAKEIVKLGGDSASAVIAMSSNFQDALSMGSYAYAYHVPVVLQTWGTTSADRGFTPEAKQWLADKDLLVAGGTGAISDASLGTNRVTRLWGETGYDTSQEIAEWMTEQGLLSASTVVIACGAQTPKGVDALSGSALACISGGGPILLANGNTALGGVDTTTIDGYLAHHSADVRRAYVLGGSYVMPQELFDRISSVLTR